MFFSDFFNNFYFHPNMEKLFLQKSSVNIFNSKDKKKEKRKFRDENRTLYKFQVQTIFYLLNVIEKSKE